MTLRAACAALCAADNYLSALQAAPPTAFCNPSSSVRRGCCWPTTRSRSLAFPVTAYGASHRGAGPSSSPFAVTFTLTMPVALPYPYAVDVAWQHLTERFTAWRTLLHPRGTHPCAPPITFTRPALPLLARLLGRRPSFVHSPPWIPPTHPSLPFPPWRTEQAILEDHR